MGDRGPVHSTADEGAVSHVDKHGHSVHGVLYQVTPHHYNVYNEAGTMVGRVHRTGDVDPLTGTAIGNWFGIHVTGRSTNTHPTRHKAARELMSMPGDVSFDADEAKYRRDVEVGKRAGLTEEEST